MAARPGSPGDGLRLLRFTGIGKWQAHGLRSLRDCAAMTTIDAQGRPEPPLAGSEAATLVAFLEFHRATLAWKCAGLDADQLARTVGASSMTLGGLLKHLAWVEDYWFGYRLLGRDPSPPWSTADWTADGDWEWHSAAHDEPEYLRSLWESSVAGSRQILEEALSFPAGLDQHARRCRPEAEAPTLRWILVHMIEEYARHNGHADLMRESIDGSVGE